ncbi:MAG: hypothetical protein RI947_887 [Candidatus Parcubacteria bacterium]|jgi:hyaluronan synthase
MEDRAGSQRGFWRVLRIVYTTLFALLILGITALSYAVGFTVIPLGIIAVGPYGILTLYHLFLQLRLAPRNTKQIQYLEEKADVTGFRPTFGLSVVGRREHRILFQKCLESVRAITYEKLEKVIVVSDGNEEEDLYMADIFREVMDGTVIVVDFILRRALLSVKNAQQAIEKAEAEIQSATELIQRLQIELPEISSWVMRLFAESQISFAQLRQEKAESLKAEALAIREEYQAKIDDLYARVDAAGKYCMILQPWGLKRKAMYTSLLLLASKYQLTGTTDSDSIIAPDAVSRSVKVFVDRQVYAMTGAVGIFNITNWLSFLSSLRYWYAFFLERAAQSAKGVVQCVSGPWGVYLSEKLLLILDEWVDQLFMGNEMVAGDDRRLTSLMLGLGGKVLFHPFVRVLTETPISFWRWIKQQIRWARSFFREAFLAIPTLFIQSLYMTYDLLFQSAFPLFLFYSILSLFFDAVFRGSYVGIVTMFITVLFGGVVRATYAIRTTGRWRFIVYPLYGVLMYVPGLLPAKIGGLLTIWYAGWGTSMRVDMTHIKEGEQSGDDF